MQQKIIFTLPESKAQHPVISLKGFEALSKPFRFYFSFQFPIESPEEVLLGKTGLLLFNNQAKIQRTISGVIIKSGIKGYRSNTHKIIFATLAPQIHLLKNYINASVFLNQSVLDIAQTLLIQHAGYYKHQIILLLKHQYPKLSFCMQPPGESDFHFINRLLTKNGIYYYFINNSEKIVLCDDNYFLNKQQEKLQYYSKHNWQSQNAIYNLSIKNNFVTSRFSVRDYNDHLSDLTINQVSTIHDDSTQNNTHMDFFGLGVNDNLEAEKLVKNYKQHALNKRFNINFISHNMNITLNTVIPIDTENFNSKYSDDYLITAITHHYQAPSHDNSDGNSFPYLNRCRAIKYSTKFQASIPKNPEMPPYLLAKIESDSTFPHLDKYGRYQLRFMFDRSEKPNTQASIPIRHLHTYVGPLSNNDNNDNLTGWHFPLHHNTEVLVGFFNENPDKPFIIGNLPNNEAISPVTAENLQQNRFISYAGNLLIFDDNPQTQKIAISTPHHENRLQINSNIKNQDIELASQKGNINCYSNGNINEKTGANYILKVNQKSEYQIKNDYRVKTDIGSIQYCAKKQIEFLAKKQIKLYSNKNIKLNSNHLLYIQSIQNITFRSTSTSYSSLKEKLILRANSLRLDCTGNIHLTNGNAGILLTPSGTITLYGKTISGNIAYSTPLNQSGASRSFPSHPSFEQQK